MAFPEITKWVVLTDKGAFQSSGSSVTDAAKGFLKFHQDAEIHGIFLAEIVQLPPRADDRLPFRCSIMGPGKFAT